MRYRNQPFFRRFPCRILYCLPFYPSIALLSLQEKEPMQYAVVYHIGTVFSIVKLTSNRQLTADTRSGIGSPEDFRTLGLCPNTPQGHSALDPVWRGILCPCGDKIRYFGKKTACRKENFLFQLTNGFSISLQSCPRKRTHVCLP